MNRSLSAFRFKTDILFKDGVEYQVLIEKDKANLSLPNMSLDAPVGIAIIEMHPYENLCS